ncbi:MAG: cell division protein FtsA, partial [Candidatus Cloacimonetes bacterium]|nr:cell division protein FtsA [Candidatus Cloacimonadota bacterium]
MKPGQLITAMDIGTTKICVIIAELNEEMKLEVKGIGTGPSEGLANGVVIDMMKASGAIKSAVEKAEDMAEINTRTIFVGIAGSHIKSQNTLGRISLSSGSEPCEINRAHVESVITNSKNNV